MPRPGSTLLPSNDDNCYHITRIISPWNHFIICWILWICIRDTHQTGDCSLATSLWSYGPIVLHIVTTDPTSHWSYDPIRSKPLVLHTISPMTHWFYNPLVLWPIGPTRWKPHAVHIVHLTHWFYNPLVLLHNSPTVHWFYTSERIRCKVHWSYGSLVWPAPIDPTDRNPGDAWPIVPTTRWPYDSVIRWFIGPTTPLNLHICNHNEIWISRIYQTEQVLFVWIKIGVFLTMKV